MRLVAGSSKMKLTDWLSKSLSISLLALVAVCTGAVPGLLGKQPFLSLELAVAQQPSVTPQEITNYARASLEILRLLVNAEAEIKKITGMVNVPAIMCNDSSSFPRGAENIAKNFCDSSQQIVEKNGLTIERFNQIKIESQKNSDLQRQIANEMRRLVRQM